MKNLLEVLYVELQGQGYGCGFRTRVESETVGIRDRALDTSVIATSCTSNAALFTAHVDVQPMPSSRKLKGSPRCRCNVQDETAVQAVGRMQKNSIRDCGSSRSVQGSACRRCNVGGKAVKQR